MPEKLYGLTEKDVKHQRRVNARVMGDQGSEKPHRRRQRQRGKGPAAEPVDASISMALITGEVSAASLGGTHISLGSGLAVPYSQDSADPPGAFTAQSESEFTIYNKHPFAVKIGKVVDYAMVGTLNPIPRIIDKDCG